MAHAVGHSTVSHSTGSHSTGRAQSPHGHSTRHSTRPEAGVDRPGDLSGIKKEKKDGRNPQSLMSHGTAMVRPQDCVVKGSEGQ